MTTKRKMIALVCAAAALAISSLAATGGASAAQHAHASPTTCIVCSGNGTGNTAHPQFGFGGHGFGGHHPGSHHF